MRAGDYGRALPVMRQSKGFSEPVRSRLPQASLQTTDNLNISLRKTTKHTDYSLGTIQKVKSRMQAD